MNKNEWDLLRCFALTLGAILGGTMATLVLILWDYAWRRFRRD